MTEAPNELRFSFTGLKEHRDVFIEALGKNTGLSLIFYPPDYNRNAENPAILWRG